jgi:hypothetical protein
MSTISTVCSRLTEVDFGEHWLTLEATHLWYVVFMTLGN